MKLSWIIALISINIHLNCRELIGQETLTNQEIYQQLTGRNYIDKSFTNKGIFFRNSYLPGKIIFTSGDSIEGIDLRYSCLGNELIWLNKDIGPVLLDKEVIKAFELKSYDTLFRFIKYKTKLLNDTSSFYQVLIDNNVKLLALRKAIKVSEYYVRNTQYSVFTQSSQFVLLVNQKEHVIPNFKRKTIINLFPDKEDKIKDFLKQYPFKIRTETDLMHFIEAISGILLE